MKHYRSAAAFTLIELLVVIAIIALLIGILLPALGGARREGQRVVSSAHIRSNASMVFFYANDNRDEFVNPFGGRTCPSMTPGQRNVRAWLWVKGRECQVGWDYESAGQQSETYGHHWLGHTMYQEDINISRIETIAAPGDVALRNWLRENEDSNA